MYHMKMCTWFLIFVSAIFYQVMALTDSYLVPATPATSFVELAKNFASWSEDVHVILNF